MLLLVGNPLEDWLQGSVDRVSANARLKQQIRRIHVHWILAELQRQVEIGVVPPEPGCGHADDAYALMIEFHYLAEYMGIR